MDQTAVDASNARHAPTRQAREDYQSRVRGCLLGGAMGDALGGPVEFWSLDQILDRCGPEGVQAYEPELVDGVATHGRVTDDTQMTLFTVEGIIRASVRTDRGLGFTVGVVHHAYERWLDTQLLPAPSGERDGWLQGERWLYARRAPGTTCITALTEARRGEAHLLQSGHAAVNASKGCGGVMRSAPWGLLPPWSNVSLPWQFDSAAHGCVLHLWSRHRPGGLRCVRRAHRGPRPRGRPELSARRGARRELARHDVHVETTRALVAARQTAASSKVSFANVESLGGGWVAEEALAIAVHAALSHPLPEDFRDALTVAVTHSGDSDSTGAICGNILGALHGETALPAELAFKVEGRGTILLLADDLAYEFCDRAKLHGDYRPFTRWADRYPGW